MIAWYSFKQSIHYVLYPMALNYEYGTLRSGQPSDQLHHHRLAPLPPTISQGGYLELRHTAPNVNNNYEICTLCVLKVLE